MPVVFEMLNLNDKTLIVGLLKHVITFKKNYLKKLYIEVKLCR